MGPNVWICIVYSESQGTFTHPPSATKRCLTNHFWKAFPHDSKLLLIPAHSWGKLTLHLADVMLKWYLHLFSTQGLLKYIMPLTQPLWQLCGRGWICPSLNGYFQLLWSCPFFPAIAGISPWLFWFVVLGWYDIKKGEAASSTWDKTIVQELSKVTSLSDLRPK